MKLLNVSLLIVIVSLLILPFLEPQGSIRGTGVSSLNPGSQLNWDNDMVIALPENKNTAYMFARNIEEDTRQGEEVGKSRNIVGLVMDSLPLEVAYLFPPRSVSFSDRDSLPEPPPPKYSA